MRRCGECGKPLATSGGVAAPPATCDVCAALASRSKTAPITFDEIARAPEPMALHDLGAPVSSRGGAIGPVGSTLEPIAIGGTEAQSISAVFGRWPERVWAAVTLGWQWSGMSGGPGTPVPKVAIVERVAGGDWSELEDLTSIHPWPGAAIGVDRAGVARVLGDGGPVPTTGRKPVIGRCVQVHGAHAFARAGLPMLDPWTYWHFPPGERTGRRIKIAGEAPEHIWFAVNDDGVYAVYPGFFGTLANGALRPLPPSFDGVAQIAGFGHHLWAMTSPPALYDGSTVSVPPLPGPIVSFADPFLVCATGSEYVLVRQRLA